MAGAVRAVQGVGATGQPDLLDLGRAHAEGVGKDDRQGHPDPGQFGCGVGGLGGGPGLRVGPDWLDVDGARIGAGLDCDDQAGHISPR